MTHDAKLPDEQGKAPREWALDKDFDVNMELHPGEEFADVAAPGDIHVIEYAALEYMQSKYDDLNMDYAQLEARCEELEAENERLKKYIGERAELAQPKGDEWTRN